MQPCSSDGRSCCSVLLLRISAVDLLDTASFIYCIYAAVYYCMEYGDRSAFCCKQGFSQYAQGYGIRSILFNVKSIPYVWIRRLFYFNPVTYIVEGYRNCFARHIWFFEQWKQLLCFLFVLFVFAMIALWLYKRLRKEIPDVL